MNVAENPHARESLRKRLPYIASGIEAEVLGDFDAQLGEIGWHVVQSDNQIDEMSEKHAAATADIIEECGLNCPRILELGAYAHYSAQIAATRSGGVAVSHDISAASLRTARRRANDRGFDAPHIAVAGDFHSLPFEDGSFDLVFIASAVHHTWRPWEVLAEMVRVTRAGGIIHLENEPVARGACMYQFRGNRPGNRTAFEEALEQQGLTHTVVSPFPGSRAEELFGMVENDRIPIEVYETAFDSVTSRVHWSLMTTALFGEFERWMEESRTVAEIAVELKRRILIAAAHFSVRDKASGFRLPSNDEIWPLAYRIDQLLREKNGESDKARIDAKIYGAALKATVRKNGAGEAREGWIRKLDQIDGVLVDDSENRLVNFSNVMPSVDSGLFGNDWLCIGDKSEMQSLCNLRSDNILNVSIDADGFVICRFYSVAMENPYLLSVLVDGERRYSHYVTGSESHLAKIFRRAGQQVSIHIHDNDGEPVEGRIHIRLVPGFVSLR